MFKFSIDKDYYKPILVKSGYDNNYIQYESKGDKTLTLIEYLALIEQYLRKLINYYKNKGEWKVQLTAEISFISLKPGSDETRAMHTRSDNEEFMNGSDTDEIPAVTLALNLDKIKKDLQRRSKIKPFIEQYNWKDIDFPSTSKDWKKFESNNEIALNILFVPHNTKKIHVAYKLRHNLTCDKQVVLLMISNGEIGTILQ